MSKTPREKFEYIHTEEIGNGQFYIAKLPNGELLFIYLDKYGYFNIFPNMTEYTSYAANDLTCKRDCIEDSWIEEGEEGYEEGVDALDRYLRTMSEPIGAWANIRYLNEPDTVHLDRYFSFGEDPGEDEHDKYGIPDLECFYYAVNGETELKGWNAQLNRDFDIVAYSLRYREVDTSDGGAG